MRSDVAARTNASARSRVVADSRSALRTRAGQLRSPSARASELCRRELQLARDNGHACSSLGVTGPCRCQQRLRLATRALEIDPFDVHCDHLHAWRSADAGRRSSPGADSSSCSRCACGASRGPVAPSRARKTIPESLGDYIDEASTVFEPSSLTEEQYARWWQETGFAELRQILYWLWDPINVNNAFPLNDDEYDRYAKILLSRLRKGASAIDVADYCSPSSKGPSGCAVPSI
jgi:hypothetical protein